MALPRLRLLALPAAQFRRGREPGNRLPDGVLHAHPLSALRRRVRRPTSTLLLFWCFALPDRPVLGAFLYALALFNHECALFALPWVVLPSGGERLMSRRTLLKLALCGLAVALLLLWRHWVASQVVVRFSNEFYLHRVRKNLGIIWELFPLGVFEAFRLFWFFPFFALVDSIAAREPRRALWVAAVLAGAGAQFLFVYDVSRLMGLLAFPAVLFGAERFRERHGERPFARLAWALVCLNFLVPAYEVKPPKVLRYWPVWWAPFRPPLEDVTWPLPRTSSP